MEQYRVRPSYQTPMVIKYLIIINVVMFILTLLMEKQFGNTYASQIPDKLSLYFFKSENFRIWQPITHMFMHGSIPHIFFNMFALWMFGRSLEHLWGGKKFLTYYLITGLGAAFLHVLINYIQFSILKGKLDPEQVQLVFEKGLAALQQSKNFVNDDMAKMNIILNIPSVGASGAVFGILLAFGMSYPNTIIMLLFPPIPMKAKWFVLIYGAAELWFGIMNLPGDNIAHFAHLGGMVFGFIMLRYWKQQKKKKLEPFDQAF